MTKRLTFLVLLLALLSGVAASPYLAHRRQAFQAGGASYTLEESYEVSQAVEEVGKVGNDYFAGAWTAGSSYTITQAEVLLYAVGSPTHTVTLYIYSEGAGEPDTLLATSTNTVDASTVTTDTGGQWVAFTFSGLALTGSTTYRFVVRADPGVGSTNYLRWIVGAAAISDNDYSSDAVTWTQATTRQVNIRLYSSP